jgi:hypothetical protein
MGGIAMRLSVASSIGVVLFVVVAGSTRAQFERPRFEPPPDLRPPPRVPVVPRDPELNRLDDDLKDFYRQEARREARRIQRELDTALTIRAASTVGLLAAPLGQRTWLVTTTRCPERIDPTQLPKPLPSDRTSEERRTKPDGEPFNRPVDPVKAPGPDSADSWLSNMRWVLFVPVGVGILFVAGLALGRRVPRTTSTRQ